MNELIRKLNVCFDNVVQLKNEHCVVFSCQYRKQDIILKLVSPRNEMDLKKNIRFQRFLCENDIPVEKLFTGITIESIEHNGKTYFIIPYEKIVGKNGFEVKRDSSYFSTIGRIIGKMHKVIKTSPEFSSPSCSFEKSMEIESPSALDIIEANLRKKLASFKDPCESKGYIHSDIHSGNIIINPQGSVTIIDFTDSTYDWYIADLVNILYEIHTQEKSDVIKKEESFLGGYYEYSTLTSDSFEIFNALVRLSDISELRNIEMRNEAKGEYYEKLKERVARGEPTFSMHLDEWSLMK